MPIAPDLGWTEVRTYSREIAERAAATVPDRYTLSAKEDRAGRVYLDDMRNVRMYRKEGLPTLHLESGYHPH